MKRFYSHLPVGEGGRGPSRWELAKGALLGPWYWLIAHALGAPGLAIHRRSALLALSLAGPRATLPRGELFRMIFRPLDSVRYFEHDFFWRVLGRRRLVGAYLDVSSPRLLPVLLLREQPGLQGELLNPDPRDLEITARLVQACGLLDRCRLHPCRLDQVPFPAGSFEVITSMSVLEHIPDETPVLRRMWQLLKPGGWLVLSVPCAAEGSEEYVDFNEYGLLPSGPDGYSLGQRFYDGWLLEERIFAVTGPPSVLRVYGEREPGSLLRNRQAKIRSRGYPFWKEPWMVGRDFTYFDSFAGLRGWGVVAMAFQR